MTATFFLPFLLVLAVTAAAGVQARHAVSGSSDYTNGGGRLGSPFVAGALIGGFVGGTSIVGTGELAYRMGLTSLWFTLGGGLSIMLLGLFAARFRRVRVETLPALIGEVYGNGARMGASLFLSAGMFIQVVAQIFAALPLVSTVWEAALPLQALVPALLILAYVGLGGFMGASVVGAIKTVLLTLLLAGTGVWLSGALEPEVYASWAKEGRLSLFQEGVGSALAQCAAMTIGIFSTQAYLQPIFAARDARSARRGAVAAGLGVIAVGLVSAWIGMYMSRVHPSLPPREAVPQFFLLHTPNWVAGFAYAVILLSVVMTGAALALSISTVLNRDVIQRLTRRFAADRAQLLVSKALVAAVLAAAYATVCARTESLILDWTFLSMTLRGVTVFFPVLFTVLNLGPVHPRWVQAAVWGGPIVSLLWWWEGMESTGIDPLYLGSGWCLAMLALGRLRATNPLRKRFG